MPESEAPMSRCSVGSLSVEINKVLDQYAKASTEAVKTAVMNAGKTIKEEIRDRAPSNTGTYAKSWTVKKENENSTSIHIIVHAGKQAWLAHLLENGHGLHQGGRARAFPHIAPAEEIGIKQLEEEIERSLKNG